MKDRPLSESRFLINVPGFNISYSVMMLENDDAGIKTEEDDDLESIA